MALPSVPEEREQGAVQAQEQLEATAPPPLEPTPAQADENALREVSAAASEAVAPEAAVEQGAQPVAPEQQGYQPVLSQPNMWRIPHRYNRVLGTQTKPQRQAVEDIGMFWQVLASSGNVDPSVRAIAKAILGEK